VNELSDQVRMIIFVILVLLVTFVWSHFYSPPAPPAQKQGQTAGQTTPSHPVRTQSGTGTATSAPAGGTKAGTGEAAKPRSMPVARASADAIVQVESSLYSVELANHGGVVRSWKLKKYFDDQKPPHPLDLVDPDAAQQLGWPFSLLLSDPKLEAQANGALYEISVAHPAAGQPAGPGPAPPAAATRFDAPVEVTFHWSDGHLDVTKKLNFRQDYEISLEASVMLDQEPLPVAIAWRGGFGDKAVYNASQLVAVFYKVGGKLNLLQYKKLGVPSNQSQPLEQAGPMEYLGIEDQFFTATFLPDGADLVLWHWTQNQNLAGSSQPEAEMAAGSADAAPLRTRLFVGPKDLALLEREKPPLDELVNFGFTGVIAKPLLFVLQWVHRYLPNWGWTIVLLTLVINFAMFPLKMKSWRSMQKMQKVAPEIRAIQDRYKKYSMSDPRKRKMNEEVMAIYSREGINPLGSCLPMVFQMPIWWALWRVLTGAIELRHAPWIGWIHDLSAMDPYYILPAAMAVTMYLMTKMTPQTTVDPSQQKMTQLMPLMMAVFFFRLSSGLNLYMFTSNLVGVAQQLYLNRTQPLPAPKGKFKKKTE
jgi:YidC/Oxa1 family membrane protein insertase